MHPDALRFQASEHASISRDCEARILSIEYSALIRQLNEFVRSLKGRSLSRADADHIHALTKQLRMFRNGES